MAFNITTNHTGYVALGIPVADVINKFYRAVPLGPGNGNSVAVNIWLPGTVTTPTCTSYLETTVNNDSVSLTKYNKVQHICRNFGDWKALEFSRPAQYALMNQVSADFGEFVKQQFADDIVTQFAGAGFTNDHVLGAGNANFGGATAATAQDSITKLANAVDDIRALGGQTEDMAIVFPHRRVTAGENVNNWTQFSSQISTYLGNSAAFMSQDGHLRFMGVRCYPVTHDTAGWGGTSIAASGITEVAAVVLSSLRPGYGIAPLNASGNVQTGDWEDSVFATGPSEDVRGAVWRMNFYLSYAAGIASELGMSIVSNP